MTLAQLRDVIDQAVALGSIDTVYFEGGEPTLVYPIVVSAARYARERGLDFGVVTNCQFAESVEDAAVWLAPFAELGIADLSLSAYPYFTAVIEPRLLRNAVEAALGLGLADALGVLEVGAAARARRPRRRLRRPRRDHVQGAGGSRARSRAREPPARHPRHLPATRTSSRPDAATSAATASCSPARASAPGTSSRRSLAQVVADVRPRAATRRQGAHARRSVGARPRDRSRPRARALRRRVPPLLRAALAPARPLPRGARARPVLRRRAARAGRGAGRPTRGAESAVVAAATARRSPASEAAHEVAHDGRAERHRAGDDLVASPRAGACPKAGSSRSASSSQCSSRSSSTSGWNCTPQARRPSLNAC